jgi:protein O-mannosyl-transferase
VTAVAFAVYKTLKHTRLIVFGALFSLVTVALVLQLFPVGSAIIADRYTYLPYVGVGLVIGYVFHHLMSGSFGRSKQMRTTIVVVFMTFGTVLVGIRRGRCEVWKDNLSLWTDVISKYPEVPVAYNNRALTYKEQGQYDLALADLESALRINPNDVDALCNRGNWYFLRGDHDKALVDLERALSVRAVPTGYNSRGAVHFNKGAFDKALADFNRAVELKPDYAEAYLNRANVLSVMQKYDKALADFDTYLAYDPNNAKAYYWRGLARYGLGNLQDAARDFGTALQISPQFGEAYQARSRVFESLKKYGDALQDALRAKSLGQNVDPDFLERLKQSTQ